MRKVTYGGAISLDSYLARPDYSVDWLRWSDEAAEMMAAYWKNIDTVLWGRKTWEVAVRSSQGRGFSKARNYLFSRTLAEEPRGFTLVRENAGDFVRSLKEQKGKDICLMGGGDLARSLFEADVIDEVGFNIHPTFLGSGIPAIHPMGRQIELDLLECRPFKNGCVYVLYRVQRRETGRFG